MADKRPSPSQRCAVSEELRRSPCRANPSGYNQDRDLMPAIYPFTAIVGQERMRRALILNAVDTRIGGVLIRGERGTAKSTAARAPAASPRIA